MELKTKELRVSNLQQGEHICACFNLRKAARAITQLYDDAFRPMVLRATQMPILVWLKKTGPITLTKLSGLLVMDRTTLTRNLKLLEKHKLLRVETGRDRRAREITLTDRGHKAVAKAFPLWKKVQDRVVKRVGEARFQRLLSDLSVVVASTR